VGKKVRVSENSPKEASKKMGKGGQQTAAGKNKIAPEKKRSRTSGALGPSKKEKDVGKKIKPDLPQKGGGKSLALERCGGERIKWGYIVRSRKKKTESFKEGERKGKTIRGEWFCA